MMRQRSYEKLDGSEAKPLRTRLGATSAITFLGIAVMVASCSEPEEIAIVGSWRAEIPGSTSAGYSGDWEINGNGTYSLDFINSGGILPPRPGHASGTYRLLSDSIMIVTVLEDVGLEYNWAFRVSPDTLFIDVQNGELKSSGATKVGPATFEPSGIILEWEKK